MTLPTARPRFPWWKWTAFLLVGLVALTIEARRRHALVRAWGVQALLNEVDRELIHQYAEDTWFHRTLYGWIDRYEFP